MSDKIINNNIKQLSLFNVGRHCHIEKFHQNGRIFIELVNELDDCFSALRYFFQQSAKITAKILSAEFVFIKVNLTSGERPENGRTTHPHFLRILINSLIDLGLPKHCILVGDSSVIGVDTIEAAKVAGIYDVCTEYAIPFLNLFNGPFVEKKVKKPILTKVIPIHELFTDESVFTINCAKIKTTYGSPVGFCVKNLKGIIPDEFKLRFHLIGVQESLADLRKVATCDLNILEGFPGSELGVPMNCPLLGVSTSDYLLDSIVSELIGIPYKTVPHLNILAFHEDSLINKVLSKYSTKLYQENIPKFKYTTHGIDKMAALFSIEIIDGKPCTSCLESFHKALVKLNKEGVLPYDFTYIIGLWHVNTEWELYESNKHVFIGQCALQSPPSYFAKNCPNENNFLESIEIANKGVPIPGCPPTIDSMISIIKNIKVPTDNDSSEGRLSLSATTNYRRSHIIEQWIEPHPLQNYLIGTIIPRVVEIIPSEVVTFNNFSKDTAMQCELISAAICHQMNWDFLRSRVYEKAIKDANYWNFSKLNNFNATDIDELLDGYPKTERYFSEQRAGMLRQLSRLSLGIHETLAEVIRGFNDQSNIENNVLELLNGINVFSDDPEMKKLQILIHSLFRSKLLDIDENKIVRPTIDYHLMRLYIRRGNIWHKNTSGYRYLRTNIKRLSSTTSALRSIVADSLKLISFYSKVSLVDVNGAEWWIGRSICSRENPDCDMLTDSGKWLRPYFSKCPYIEICFAQTCDRSLLKVNEPHDISQFY